MSEMRRKPSAGMEVTRNSGQDIAPRYEWNWCTKLGVVLIVLGILAISMSAASVTNSVLWLSWLIVVAGLAETAHAFHLRKSAEFFFHLVSGIASVPLGLLVATHPAVGLVPWMLVFACVFTIVGLFRLVSAVHLKPSAWRWAVLDLVVMLVLGA